MLRSNIAGQMIKSSACPALAADLAGRQVSLILAAGRPDAALAAKAVTTSIPIVFNNGSDPVQLGLVASLSRPGGNVTGITTASAELEAKRLGLLRELVPSATSIAVLVNPGRPGVNAQLVQAQRAAPLTRFIFLLDWRRHGSTKK